MKSAGIVSWCLLVGLNLVLPLGGDMADDDRVGAATLQGSKAQDEKPTIASVPGDQKGKAGNREDEARREIPVLGPGELVYTRPPPLIGAPGGLVGGSSRGTGNDGVILSVFAPDHTGLTVQEQPSLYWYLSKSTTYPVELTIIDDQAIQPLLETRISTPVQPGVQRVQLAEYGVRLSSGVQYQWFVALVLDPDRRSKDIIVSGAIKRVELPEGLRAQLTGASTADAPRLYAAAGLWYDALSALSDLLDTAPHDPLLRRQWASLLEQGDWPAIGRYETWW